MSAHEPPAERPSFGLLPGPGYRWTRRLLQTLALLAVVIAPVLGGWQRTIRSDMAVWGAGGFDLIGALRRALPSGEAARTAHELNLLKGGGIAHDYFGIAAMDPLAGAVALMRGGLDARALLAWLLPLALGLTVGRAFCGWLCPFGTLARWLDAGLALAPWHHRISLPKRRPVRFVVALLAIAAGFFGFHLLLYILLPYLLLQHAAYAAWLLGGGSAALAMLAGLLLAGVIFGPTTYCATLCPTGGVLSLLGRVRRLRLTLQDPRECGRSCTLCSRACWLQLHPAAGDPGPDCDLCARCVPACPRTNLVVTARAPRRRLPVVTVLLALGCVSAASPTRADSDVKPRLVLDTEVRRGQTTLAVSVVDVTGVELVGGAGQSGIELSVFLARGPRGKADAEGLLPGRDVYRGPLTIHLVRQDTTTSVPFEFPNSPRSTQGKAIYRVKLPMSLAPGDVVHVLPVAGWLEPGERFAVPPGGTGMGTTRGAGFFVAGLLIFGGLLSLSLSCR